MRICYDIFCYRLNVNFDVRDVVGKRVCRDIAFRKIDGNPLDLHIIGAFLVYRCMNCTIWIKFIAFYLTLLETPYIFLK